jgi:hypothetical protein
MFATNIIYRYIRGTAFEVHAGFDFGLKIMLFTV